MGRTPRSLPSKDIAMFVLLRRQLAGAANCLAAGILAAVVLAAVTPSETVLAAGPLPAKIRERIERQLIESQVPSLAIAVARDGKILWEQGFGWADRERRIAADEHTMYSLASISKPITATGLMVLVQQGKLDLDRPANQYLGDALLTGRAGDASEATLRRLANHTAGLPLHYQFFYADETNAPPPRDESIRRYGQLLFEPGWRYQYANFGYGILDYVIQRQSGDAFADFMRREVFLPLDMTRTAVGVPRELARFQAIRYHDQKPLPHYDFDHPGASAVYSSAHDLVRFGMFHLKQPAPNQKAILGDEWIDAMQEPTAIVRPDVGYGVGWFIHENDHGIRTVSHTGGMGGVRTRLTLVPDERLVIVALCNSGSNLPMEATQWILSELLPAYRERREADGQRKATPPVSPPAQQPSFDPPGQLVGLWRGRIATWQGELPVEMRVQSDGDVHVRVHGQLVTLLNEPRIEDGCLWGVMNGDVGTPDANRRPYQLHLRLRIQDQTLRGACRTISLPGERPGNALSYWMELTKQPMTLAKPLALLDPTGSANWRVVEEADFENHGPVEFQDGQVLLGQGRSGTAVAWRGDFPRIDYEVTLEAKRMEGDDFFCGMTFPVGDSYCTLILGGWGGGVTGLSNIDGMAAVENETTGYIKFEQNRWYRVRLRVARDKIEAWVDDDQVVDVTSKDRKFSIWWEQEPARPFGIASWNTKAALRKLVVKPLAKSEQPKSEQPKSEQPKSEQPKSEQPKSGQPKSGQPGP
jgi:CubicO group peptidase (beta-lactamase class C family)